jgi:DNA polymerase elongation subunit (family B)
MDRHHTAPGGAASGESWEIAVRGYLVPDADALRQRRANRRQRQDEPDATPNATFTDGAPRQTPDADAGATDTSRDANNANATPDDDAELASITAILGPRPWLALVPDTETRADPNLQLRVAYYEVRGIGQQRARQRYRDGTLRRADLDRIIQAGLVAADDPLFPTDMAAIQQYAGTHPLHRAGRPLPVWTPQQFIQDVFYLWVYRYGARLVAHNLFFDLTRFATSWKPASRDYRGGFTLKLCDCPRDPCWTHPPLRYQPLGRFKQRLQFQHSGGRYPAGTPFVRRIEGHFVDTATLGLALAGRQSPKLEALAKAFGLGETKHYAPDFTAPLDEAFLDYLVQDVRLTAQLYAAKRDTYAQHGRTRSLDTIYSEASLGKAYNQDTGVPTATQRPWRLPHERVGQAMTAYYGGRSEVHDRLRLVEGRLYDFKSQYPTVNALLGLQRFLLATTVTLRDVTAETQAWLAAPDLLDQLQRPATWLRLAVLACLRPQGDLLSVRARYDGTTFTIGQQYLTSKTPLWYTLADVVASVLRTGRVPTILSAVELALGVEQVPTTPIALFGRAEYTIDLTRDDLFTRVIDLRTEVKAEMARARVAGNLAEAARLDGLQRALKLVANATAYGVLLEVNEHVYGGRALPIDVYALDAQRRYGNRVEELGPYFAGAIGPFIPAAGRLTLAIAERLGADRGLSYAFCDTDSLFLTRLEGMARDAFQAHCQAIADWFAPLSPYMGQPPLFEDEDVNRWEGQPEPLYCLAVSAKRYVLFNKLSDGTYRLRKFSSHGLGLWGRRTGFVRPAHIPAPCADAEELGGPEWVYCLWYEAVRAIDTGRLANGQPLPRDPKTGAPQYRVPPDNWLSAPAYYQLTISTWDLWERFKDVPGMRPGNFLTVLPAVHPRVMVGSGLLDEEGEELDDEALAWHLLQDGSSLYTGYCDTVEDVEAAHRAGQLRRVGDGQRLSPEVPLTTMAEVLQGYFLHPEAKAATPQGVGPLPRRHVTVEGVVAIGKESNRLALMQAEETAGTMGGDAMGGIDVYGVTGERETLASLFAEDICDQMAATCLPRSTLYAVRHGTGTPSEETLAALQEGIRLLDPDNPRTIVGWREALPTAEALATVLGCDADRARALWRGKARWTPEERGQMVVYLAATSTITSLGTG